MSQEVDVLVLLSTLKNSVKIIDNKFTNLLSNIPFTNLTDVPSNYTGHGGKFVKVKVTEDGLEFVSASGGLGDVVGPASSVNNNIVLFDGVTGKLIKDSGVGTGAFALASHTHPISDVVGLQTALDGKAALSHSHIIADVTGLQTALDGKAALTHTHIIADVTGLQTALDGKQPIGSYAAASHTHVIADVTNLQTTLDGKAPLSHTHAISDVTGLQTALDGKAALSHTHAISDVTGLQTALDGKAALSHTHAISDVTGLQTALDGKAALSHTHLLSNVTDVTMSVTNLNSLDDGVDSTLHFHNSDRNRANHTGTQLASTISDFNTSVDARIAAANINDLADVIITAPSNGQVIKYNGTNWINDTDNTGGGGVSDGDKGDISVTGSGTVWTIDNGVVTNDKLSTGIDAAKLATGVVSNTEFEYLNGVTSAIQTQIDGKANTSHTHAASDITSGTIDTARLGSGTANNTTYLRGDNTWATVTATDPSGYTTILKELTQDVTNSGLTNDADFTFSVVAGGHYAVEMQLIVSGNDTTGDYTADFQVSAGTMRGKGTCQTLSSTAAVQNIIITAAGTASTTAIVTGAPTANIDDLVAVRMFFAFTASSNATFRYRFGNAAAAAGRISRVWKGSIMKYKRLD